MAEYEIEYDTEVVAQQEDTGGGGEPIPEDSYEFTIYEAEVKSYAEGSANAGRQRLALTLKVADGPYRGRQVWEHNIPLFPVWKSGKPAFQFKQFFGTAMELLDDSGKLKFDIDDLQGATVKAQVGIEQPNAEQKEKGYGPSNRIKRYLPPTAEVSNGEGVVIKEPAKKEKKKPSGKL